MKFLAIILISLLSNSNSSDYNATSQAQELEVHSSAINHYADCFSDTEPLQLSCQVGEEKTYDLCELLYSKNTSEACEGYQFKVKNSSFLSLKGHQLYLHPTLRDLGQCHRMPNQKPYKVWCKEKTYSTCFGVFNRSSGELIQAEKLAVTVLPKDEKPPVWLVITQGGLTFMLLGLAGMICCCHKQKKETKTDTLPSSSYEDTFYSALEETESSSYESESSNAIEIGEPEGTAPESEEVDKETRSPLTQQQPMNSWVAFYVTRETVHKRVMPNTLRKG